MLLHVTSWSGHCRKKCSDSSTSILKVVTLHLSKFGSVVVKKVCSLSGIVGS